MVQVRGQGKLRHREDLEVLHLARRRGNLKFNQDDNGLMKNKHPGFVTEHLYRTVRSEGPVTRHSFSFEDRSDSSSSQP